MPVVSDISIAPPDDHLVTAYEALEPLYERLELENDRALLAAAVDAGGCRKMRLRRWPSCG